MDQQSQSQRTLLLDIAREALRQRAARDGYAPGDYDVARDPEDYVSSLLNALHQFCHRYGIDWDREMTTAQGFFEQDRAKSQPLAAPPSPPEVGELRCPKCGQAECFIIEVRECLLMFAEGTVLHGDTGEEWGDWSYCRCHTCQYMGTVYQFRRTSQTKEVKTNG